MHSPQAPQIDSLPNSLPDFLPNFLPNSPTDPATDLPTTVQTDLSCSPWFDYPVQVHPHHTDYAGIVWHGSYIRWMEEVRVIALAKAGVAFSELVNLGCDLPVVDLQIRYRQAMRMGSAGILKARMQPHRGVRLVWDYELWSADGAVLHLTARVTLVAIDRASGKIMRRLPRILAGAIATLGAEVSPNSPAEGSFRPQE
ncbi:MAG: acyl-CoA thioesterase [Synechococcales cyanobacterium RU_4_20]|nr:acyl-CoA thioesterase [Synechococcales cyanobacterium RU_4_20]NJR67710.1 acyl-CoA thioesterase [Synechococcales cyanobacterium CRU_2_2]